MLCSIIHSQVTGGIPGNWGFRPPNLPFPWGTELLSNTVTWDHTSVPAKWHLIPSNSFSKVHECNRWPDRQTDRPRYGNMCRSRRNRFQRPRLKLKTPKCGRIRTQKICDKIYDKSTTKLAIYLKNEKI